MFLNEKIQVQYYWLVICKDGVDNYFLLNNLIFDWNKIVIFKHRNALVRLIIYRIYIVNSISTMEIKTSI